MIMWSFNSRTGVRTANALALFALPLFAAGTETEASALNSDVSLPRITAGADGFSISSVDREFELRLRASVQADARWFLGDSRGTDTFLLRRVRPSLEGNAGWNISFRVMPDLAPEQPSLIDAWANLKVTSGVQIRVGKLKVPFDLERLVSQTDLLFVERGHPSSLGPNRDIGVQLHGRLDEGFADYSIGIFNGVPDGGSSVNDMSGRKELTTRVFVHPFHREPDSFLRRLGLGLAVSHGNKKGETPSGYKTLAQENFFSFRSGVENRGAHLRVSPQGYFYHGPFGLLASWTLSSQELARGLDTARIKNTAWLLAGSWVLTGEDASYRQVSPAKPFDPAEHSWGAFELTARLSGLRIDDDAFPVFAAPESSARRTVGTTLGLNWHLNQNLKVVANFEHATFDGGASVGDRPDENAVLTRFQLNF